jgi:glycosyltransferase involved in cell wall biosynthesis
MKILRLIGSLDPSHGGPPVSAVNSAIAAQRAGADTTIAFAAHPDAPDPPAVAKLRAEGVAAERYPYCGMMGRRAEAWGVSRGLMGALRRGLNTYDIVQCHGAWQMATAAALVCGGRAKRLLMPHESLTEHDVDGASSARLGAAKTILRRRIVKRFDCILFSSAIEQRDSMTDPARSVVAHHAVFDERADAPHTGRAGDGFVLGYLGRLHPKKNVDLLIEALARCDTSVTLRIAGDGPERDRLTALAATCGVADRVTFLGFVDDARKREFLSQIDALALVSDYECFGMAAAEAMIAGLPVIVSPETGLTGIVRDEQAGLVAACTADAVAGAIGQMAAGGEARQTMADAAARAARAHLSFGAHGTALLAAYEAVLAGTR